MAFYLTNRGAKRIAEAGWPNLALLATLMADTYTPSRDDNVMSDIVAHEYPGVARQTLAGMAVTQDNPGDRAVLSADDPIFPTVAPSGLLEVVALVVLEDGANDGVRNLIGIVDVADTPPTGLDIAVAFSADGVIELLT